MVIVNLPLDQVLLRLGIRDGCRTENVGALLTDGIAQRLRDIVPELEASPEKHRWVSLTPVGFPAQTKITLVGG